MEEVEIDFLITARLNYRKYWRCNECICSAQLPGAVAPLQVSVLIKDCGLTITNLLPQPSPVNIRRFDAHGVCSMQVMPGDDTSGHGDDGDRGDISVVQSR